MVFIIGGDGTHRGIKELSKILKEKKKENYISRNS